MNYFAVILMHCFFLPAIKLNGAVQKIAENTTQIEIANINCSIPCNSEALYCDTIAISEDKRYAQTCELPFFKLTDSEAKVLLSDFSDKKNYSNTFEENGVKYAQSESGCFHPTIAILFKKDDSTIIAQSLFDLSCEHFLLYCFEDGRYVSIANKPGEFVIPYYDYGELDDTILKICKERNLKCLPAIHKKRK